ncbi:MAG: DUF4303 domain-containing protein [Roseburia sp.]|nr:DUF4303 domain-containing protein [Roseburia sp.]
MDEMKLTKFEKFSDGCSKKLPDLIDKILQNNPERKVSAIGFITVDDFYGFYVTWDDTNREINTYYDWKPGLNPDFLYQPLVDVVDSCKEIDFTMPSDEKWEFAEALLTVLEKNIKQIPDEIFHKNNYRRDDICFFATMEGDYTQEMLDASIKMFNDHL